MARYSGGHFLVLLPATDVVGARAERARARRWPMPWSLVGREYPAVGDGIDRPDADAAVRYVGGAALAAAGVALERARPAAATLSIGVNPVKLF